MPLRKSTISVPISTGLNQKADLRSLDVSGAVQMTNCVLQKTGAVRKRFGNVALTKNMFAGTAGGTTTVGSAIAGGSYKAAPWMVGNGTIGLGYSNPQNVLLNFSENAQGWQPADIISEAVALDRLGIMSQSFVVNDVDQAVGNGFLVVVYTAQLNPTNSAVFPYYTVIDLASRTTLVQSTLVDPAIVTNTFSPRLCVCGTTLVLTYVVSGNIIARKMDLTAPMSGWGAPTTVATDGVNNVAAGVYDLAPVGGTPTLFALAYEVLNGGNHVAIKTFSAASLTVVTAQFDDAGSTQLVSIAAVVTSGEWAWAAYTCQNGGNSALIAWAWNWSTPSTHVAPFLVYLFSTDVFGRVGIARNDASHVTTYWSPSISLSANDGTMISKSYISSQELSTAGATTGNSQRTTGLLMSSKPFVFNGAAYIAGQTPSTLQGTTFLLRDDVFGLTGIPKSTQPLRVVCTLDPRLAKFNTNLVANGNGNVCSNITLDAAFGSSVLGVMGYVNTSPSRATLVHYPIDLAHTNLYSSAEIYELEAIACGVPSVFDGQNVSELEFLQYPEPISATYNATPGSGGLGFSGGGASLYQWIACYEWTDARGQIHRSATSPPISVTTTAATTSASILMSNLALTMRRQLGETAGGTSIFAPKVSPVIVFYRTQLNGSVFYRETSDPPPGGNYVNIISGGFPVTQLANNGASPTDAQLATQPLLYTTGGNLDNFCPPSGSILISHRNRWWVAGCPDPTALWPSKEVTPGESPGFNEAMNITATGAIRGLASMDDKLIIFVQRGASYGIEFITGEGPTDAGTQSDWTPPQRIPSDAGATDQRSIVVGPFGVLFRSIVGGPTGQGGIFLLGRDLSVRYLSGPVEDTLAANPVVTAAVLSPTRGRVYFSVAPSDASPTLGVRLVWDYAQGGVWSTDQLNDPDQSLSSAAARCAWVAYSEALSGLAYHWATPLGRVYRETNGIGASSYMDAGQFVTMVYQSARLKPTEGGFARFWGMQVETDVLETGAPPQVTITLTFDGANSGYYSEPHTWTGAQLATFDRFPTADFLMTPGNQKAKSITVTVSDATSGSPVTGQGISIGGFVLELGVKDGAYRNIPPAQRA